MDINKVLYIKRKRFSRAFYWPKNRRKGTRTGEDMDHTRLEFQETGGFEIK